MPVEIGPRMGLLAQTCYAFVAVYRVSLGLFVGGHCRFTPSCSRYAQQALAVLPVGVALAQTARRLGRCHPWHAGGFDPVLSPGPSPNEPLRIR